MVDILQLRELDGIETNIGDYEILFDKPITIYPEDSISMKSCFIDTKNQDNKITFTEDNTFDIFYSFYLNNFNANTSPYFNNAPPTGNTYILCTEIAKPVNNTNLSSIQYIEFGREVPFAIPKVDLEFVYFDENQVQQNFPFSLPAFEANKGPEFYRPNLPVFTNYRMATFYFLYNGAIFNVGDQAEWQSIGWPGTRNGAGNVPYVDEIDVFENGEYETFYDYEDIVIPKGKYTPTEITQIINKKLTQLTDVNYNINDLSNISTNIPLLRNIDFFRDTSFPAPIPGNPKSYDYAWISPQEEKIYPIYKTSNTASVPPAIVPPAIFTGTDSFSFGYDEDTSLFEITESHMPIYDDNGNKVIQTLQPAGVNSLAKVVSVGGVFIYGVNQYSGPNIITDVMGFDNTLITSSNSIAIPKINNYLNTIIPELVRPLEKGVNITGEFLGVNSVTNKTSKSILVSNALTFTQVSTQSNAIKAVTPYTGDLSVEQGYYLIEITGFNNTNDYIGQKYSNNKIKAIVSRYYSINSYTSSGGESDIQYVNVSNNTQYIKSLHVRILNPDGTLATNIDNDNTVFLQINRKNLLNPYIPAQIKAIKNNKK